LHQQQIEKQKQAQDYLSTWASDKPHFEKVRPVMFGLLQSGVIPLKNGQLDLDSAYQRAIYADPEVREAIQAEEKEKADQKAAQEKKDAELKRLQKLNAAKKASTLSTRAPTGNFKPADNKNKKPMSVRDSIMAARREVEEQV